MPCSWKPRTAYTATLAAHAVVARASRIRAPVTTRENARLREEDHGGEALVEEMAGRRLQGFQIVRRPGEQVVAQVLVRKLTTLELAEVVGWPNQMPW